MSLLESIREPADLRRLSRAELDGLAREIRDLLDTEVTRTAEDALWKSGISSGSTSAVVSSSAPAMRPTSAARSWRLTARSGFAGNSR